MTKEEAAAEVGALWGLRGVDPRTQLEVLRTALDRGDTVTMVADVTGNGSRPGTPPRAPGRCWRASPRRCG